jgi:hypothetical protein
MMVYRYNWVWQPATTILSVALWQRADRRSVNQPTAMFSSLLSLCCILLQFSLPTFCAIPLLPGYTLAV